MWCNKCRIKFNLLTTDKRKDLDYSLPPHIYDLESGKFLCGKKGEKSGKSAD